MSTKHRPLPKLPDVLLDVRMQEAGFVNDLFLKRLVASAAAGDDLLTLDSLNNVFLEAKRFAASQVALADAKQRADVRAAMSHHLQEASPPRAPRLATGYFEGRSLKPPMPPPPPPAKPVKRDVVTTPPTPATPLTTFSSCGLNRDARRLFTGKLRAEIATLSVALWKAAHATSYLRVTDGRKSTESFRPFAAGVLYSFKRGVNLPDGRPLVPVLGAIQAHLPALRSNLASAAARQLQSSSHRGVCCLQRAMGSLRTMPPEECEFALTLFGAASKQAEVVVELVHRYEANGIGDG